MARQDLVILNEQIERRIFVVRGQRVMLDSDLADLYGVSTKRFNQQIGRNRKRFPRDFAFRLTTQEFASLRSQIATSNIGRGGRRYLPWAFTEQVVDLHDGQIKMIADVLQKMMEPPPEPAAPKGRFGFHPAP